MMGCAYYAFILAATVGFFFGNCVDIVFILAATASCFVGGFLAMVIDAVIQHNRRENKRK